MTTRLLLTGLAISLAAGPASAQSLFNAAGMGLPVEALDARARALGNLGIGLTEASFMPTDPAALARFGMPTGVMATQPSWVEYDDGVGGSGTFQGTRFPLMGLSYPVFGGMGYVQLGSFLDQHFALETPGSVDLQGSQIATIDAFEQDGSVSNLNIGFARMVGDNTSVGVTLGRYAGSVVRTLTRTFDAAAIGVEDYVERGKWSYTGHSITAGAATDVSGILRVATSVQVPTSLSADAAEGTDGGDGSFDLPVQLRVGSSAQLAPGLVVTASATVADWSSVADDLNEAATVGNANGFGVGLELSRARVLGKTAPLRFGFRRTGLPFSMGSETASERIFSGGIGLDLNRTENILLAGADIALERGERTSGAVSESFWRMTLSVVVASPN